MCFSGKARCERNSRDGPSQRGSWLQSLQRLEEMALQKALGVVCGLGFVHFVVFFPLVFLSLSLHVCQELLGASFVFVGGM